jgi:DNA-directed RNA polymerase subunit beta'
MAYTTTVGKILLKHYSPAATHAFLDSKELDKKNIGAFFANLAEKHPEEYMKTVSDLTRLGFESATRLGSTVRLGDLAPPDFKDEEFKKLHAEIAGIQAKKLTKVKQNDEIITALNKFSGDIDKRLVEHGVKEGKTLAKVVRAGARGSPSQYRQTIFSPVAVNDNKGSVLTDFVIDRSFAEGLTLPQYLAHTFGARQASAATKLAVADAGYLGKQLARAGMTMKVEMHDCGTDSGIAIKVEDKDYLGTYLAKAVDKYNHNNEVTSSMLADLKTKGVADIIVRSPITCQASHDSHPGAVCQLCAGRREKGLPEIGSFLGVVAGTTLAEPLSQGMLNSKHSGGSARTATSFGGFKYVNQLFNIPDSFVHEAPLANHDGVIEEVRPAPQGGNYVVVKHVNGKTEEHYVHPDLNVFIKPGTAVEAGDVLSDGIPNPAKIVKHKGIGEGRVYFANAVKNTFENSQLGGINKRNFDIISKGIITHVKITNPKGLGDHLPDTIVNYHSLEKAYTPRHDSRKVRVDQAKGLYLEIPALHYTIGTKLTSHMMDNLKKHGVSYVTVHDDSPGFEPEMQRLLDVPAHEHDWMHALYSTNLERRLVKAVNTGASSSIAGPSPIPGLAYAVGFGKKSEEVEQTEEALSFE